MAALSASVAPLDPMDIFLRFRYSQKKIQTKTDITHRIKAVACSMAEITLPLEKKFNPKYEPILSVNIRNELILQRSASFAPTMRASNESTWNVNYKKNRAP